MPRISVVLPALGGLETVRGALDAWNAQPRRAELEIVVVCPDAGEGTGRDGLLLVDSSGLRLDQARARGIRAATADFVFLAEDHCVPGPEWGEAVLEALAGGWDGVGCVLRPGDAATARSQACFLLGYGEWMPPRRSGPASVMPGHNVVVRRGALLDLGGDLEQLLVVGAFLVARLRHSQRLFLAADASMWHFDSAALGSQLRVFQTVGRSFGALRTRRWAALARVLYPLALPVVAAAHWRRALAQYRRAGRENGMRAACLVPAALFAVVWAGGEAIGALLGPERAAKGAWASEIKPVTPERVRGET